MLLLTADLLRLYHIKPFFQTNYYINTIMENISYESHRERLIVSADDFGVSSRCNRNILYLISLGKIDRVGVMTRGIITAKEIAELNRSGVKIDIHLDILHEFENERKKRAGAFARVFGFLGRMFLLEILPGKVETEWKRQIVIFQQMFGRSPDGISSHEHVHFFPLFFTIALKIQKEFLIPYLRFGSNMNLRQNTLVAHILRLLRLLNLRTFRRSSCVSSDELVSLDWLKNIDHFLNNLPEGKIEIACHPELAEDFVKIKKYF
ncbi:MAG: hypothetical protein ACD_56C00069G0005 [uncultured bacterium]|nr:MAG: hypothetical protein ACD_56C00069G0005 [uncultured bacterium]